jgi:adenylate cyclase
MRRRALQFTSVRVRRGVVLGLVVGMIGILLRPSRVGVRLEEEVGLPWLFAVRGPVEPPPDIAIVSIDKGSAQQLGMDTREWPPPRHVHTRLIRNLNLQHVSAIAMDVWFEQNRSPEDDDDLARAMAESGNVVLVQRVDRPRVRGPDVSTQSLQSPIIQLQQSAVGLAPFPLPRSPLTSFFWPFFETSAGTVPTLPAAALQVHALPLLNRLLSLLDQAGVRNLDDLPRSVISIADSRNLMQVLRRELENDPRAAKRALARLAEDASGGQSATDTAVLAALVKLYAGPDTYYLNFYGPPGSIETIPFHEFLDGRAERRDLSGKVVFIGTGPSALVTSAEQVDTYPTVYTTAEGVNLSGAEIGATAFANLLTDRTLRPAGPLLSTGALLAFGGLVGFLARALPGMHAAAITITLGAAVVGLAQFLFTAHSMLVPLAVPVLVQLPVALFVGVLSRYRDIRRQVPIEVDPHARQQVFNAVCLTTDVRGYTALAEHLTPDELHQLLDEYHEMLRRLVTARHGLVWGRGGDSALCVWKASKKEARLDACLAAIEIRDAIDRFNTRHPAAQQLPTCIGLDAGEIGLGAVGGELQAVGNPANAASRIEGLNRHLRTKLLASAGVVQDQQTLVVRRLGFFVLAGKADEVEIFEIVGRSGTIAEGDRQLCERFAAGLELFETGNWADAARWFRELALDYPADGPAPYYRDLCDRYAAAPASGGRPVIRIDTK